MSKIEILQELPKSMPQERDEVRLRLAEMDQDDWLDRGVLTETEKSIIESRLRDLDANPQTSVPWQVAGDRLLAAFKR